MSKKISLDNVRVKQEMKEEGKDSPALNARDRLKGALQQQLAHSDNSSDSDDYKSKIYSTKKLEREKAKRKKSRGGGAGSNPVKELHLQNSFVMKLFDRSVDLAQFEEHTPLYPICRAWMANAPRTVLVKREKDKNKKPKREERPSRGKLKLDEGSMKDVFSLPPPLPKPPGLEPPLPPTDLSEDFTLDYDKPLPSKDILLASHLAHWSQIRKKIKLSSFQNEERFEASKRTLKRIFTCAQKSYE